MSVNKVILVGNVGKDPEIRYLENGTAVANFSLATSESYTNKSGEKVNQTEWHNIVLWRGLAEISEKYVKKGSQVYIEGRIRTRQWDDREGNKRYTTEILADSMQMLGKRTEGGGSGDYAASHSPRQENSSTPNMQEDSIPESGGGADDLPF